MLLYTDKIENGKLGFVTPSKKIAKSQGWNISVNSEEVVKGYDGATYLKGYEPEKTIKEQNEEIRATRESLYRATSDYLKADYDEAVARGVENAEELRQAWLASKDKIRAENPYILEE